MSEYVTFQIIQIKGGQFSGFFVEKTTIAKLLNLTKTTIVFFNGYM